MTTGWTRTGRAGGAGVVLLLAARPALAAGLGIPLDGFIGTFETFVTGLGLVVGLVGLTGYVGSLMDNRALHPQHEM